MFLLGTICCRAGSKGVKDKNIKPLGGRPLVSYTFETAVQCNFLNDIIVSTDSLFIAELARNQGINFVIDRPAELARDNSSKWEVFIHAVETYEKTKGVKADYIVDMDATAPLKTAADIEGAIQAALNNPGADVIITAYEAESNPYFNMMETNSAGIANMVKRYRKSLVNRQEAPPVYSLSPAAFVIKTEALYRYSHWSEAICKLYIIPRERGVDIDTEMDFRFIEFLINTQN
jgi:N-acylneuraminate cytidylyltransferase/CMP-N,N'-diacetyllegionaminic acid synthase